MHLREGTEDDGTLSLTFGDLLMIGILSLGLMHLSWQKSSCLAIPKELMPTVDINVATDVVAIGENLEMELICFDSFGKKTLCCPLSSDDGEAYNLKELLLREISDPNRFPTFFWKRSLILRQA